MKKLLKSFALLLFTTLTLLSSLRGQDRVVEELLRLGAEQNRTMEHLDILTNRIGGRITGSDNCEVATQWIAALLKEWGLEVEVIEVGSLPVGFNRGPWWGKMLSSEGMDLHFATPSYTSGTKGVQRGHVVMEPKTRAQFERVKGVLKGAWVLITGENDGWAINHSKYADQERSQIIETNEAIKRYNDSITIINRENPHKAAKPLKEYLDAPALFYKEMREAGILGTIQSAKVPIKVMYDRANLMDLSFDNLPSCPDIKLEENQYRAIEQKVKERENIILEFLIRNNFRPGPIKFHNVIGYIRGSHFPDQLVMSGGHIDSYDVATGGVDCGTGVAPNLEAARLLSLAGAKPKRTIAFCFWGAEEFGLWGSKHWVASNREKLDKISNYFNRDGGPTAAASITVPPAMYDSFKEATEELNRIDPTIPFKLKMREGPPPPRPTTPGMSDYAWFRIEGVPAIAFENSDPHGYDFRYPDIWHTEKDHFNMSIPTYMEYSTLVTAIVVYKLANQPTLLSREALYREAKKRDKK
ncbi:MAG: M20/M25/M40 family metallo-hydrolase [Bacteroidales bacterium]